MPRHLFDIARIFVLLAITLPGSPGAQPEASGIDAGPEFTGDGQLKFPEHYRDWIYLTTGFDMSYTADMAMGNGHVFDNVFVNRKAYQAFKETGTWPDKTALVLEFRAAEGKGSINQKGNFQNVVTGIEIHVKDQHIPGKWGFFEFGGGAKTSKMFPTTANCYSCHAEHGIVDTTFVQFYPTLLPVAKSKGTIDSAHKQETDFLNK
jgi:hypothetical protein